MHVLAGLLGLATVLLVLRDLFETIVVPRRVVRAFLLFRLIRRAVWMIYRVLGRLRSARRREQVLSFYGPLSVILLLGVWAVGLVVGYALLLWSVGTPLAQASGPVDLSTTLYYSATSFFTLGLGDISPTNAVARAITAIEAGTGLIALAMVISYLPVLYQAFSRREVVVSLLDAHAGSPPTAVELLRRHAAPDLRPNLDVFLSEWETWAAQLMESHLSYPVLGAFRSQHEKQSWIGALTTILDACSLILAGIEQYPVGQARLTFAMARHAAVDLCEIYETPPVPLDSERLTRGQLAQARAVLAQQAVQLRDGDEVEATLKELRQTYEPYVNALGQALIMTLPDWLPPPGAVDDWQSTAWEPPARIL